MQIPGRDRANPPRSKANGQPIERRLNEYHDLQKEWKNAAKQNEKKKVLEVHIDRLDACASFEAQSNAVLSSHMYGYFKFVLGSTSC